MQPEDILSVAIHPGIGIARLGNAPNAHFIGPEVPGQMPPPGFTGRDPGDERLILPQAARFRIYAHLRSGEVRELTADDASIEWRVEVANLKAGWYEFNNAMDLPPNLVVPSRRRNAAVDGVDRDDLDIRPGPLTISGRGVKGNAYRFNTGRFFGVAVDLGGLMTDDKGRLLVLPGTGVSRPRIRNAQPTTFANNDGWHDDIADGPVRARVTVGATVYEAKPAYVVTTPPNYGPGLFGVVTMDDVVRDVFIRERGWLSAPARPSFTRDIWPIFDRMCALEWVNHGAFLLLGHGSPLNARDPAVIAGLTDAGAQAQARRDHVFKLFRSPDDQLLPVRTNALPPIYGDGYAEHVLLGAADLPVTRTMHAMLRAWRDGNFDADWQGFPQPPAFDTLAPAEQCEALDRAGLYDCLGGPFHPGIELSWPMRRPELWLEPYRLNLIPEGDRIVQDYGGTLKPGTCLAPGGPVAAAGPGALTRWLGVPWQTDEASCNSGREYEPGRYLSVPSFWGPRVPNQVLSSEAFGRLSTPGVPAAQKWKHFNHRSDWTRDINSTTYERRIANMVREWWRIGIVTPSALPPGSESIGLPARMHVETGRDPAYAGNVDPTLELVDAVETQKAATAAKAGLTPGAAQPDMQPLRRYGRGEV